MVCKNLASMTQNASHTSRAGSTREWTARTGKEEMQRGDMGGTGERSGWIRLEEGGQGHSCDKEVRMKDVASARP